MLAHSRSKLRQVTRSETTSDGTRIDYVVAPNTLDDATAVKLREALADIPEIDEAWIVGNRVSFPEGSCTTQSTIAFAFDPPCNALDDFTAVVEQVKSAMAWTEGCPYSWSSTSRDAVAHFWGEAAAKIYERSTRAV